MDEVGLNDRRVETSQFERYKGRKGVTDRVGFISATLLRAWRYYIEATRTGFRAPSDAALLALCKQHIGEPDQRFGLVLFHYKTDENGVLLDQEKCQGKPKIWTISEARYAELSQLHASWPMMRTNFGEAQYDLLIKCTEESFQRMTFTPTPECHFKKKQKWFDTLVAKEAQGRQKAKLALGKELSEDEIKAALGISTPASAPTAGGDMDLDSIVDDL